MLLSVVAAVAIGTEAAAASVVASYESNIYYVCM
jgi:hypothetical protein